MSDHFTGRVAIITGAGAGLGRSHALGLAAAGAEVALLDRAAPDAVAAEIAAAGGTALAFACDVTDRAAVDAVVAQVLAGWGRIDILVNNAGILRDKTFAKLTPEHWAQVLDVHLTGSFNATQAVWPAMVAQGYGRVVLTSSASGLFGNFGQSNYAAAKAAMVGLMHVLHLEGARHDIRVNTLYPTARTAMTEGLIPPEDAALLTSDSVTPAVLYLTHADAPSRLILGAGAGVFTVAQLTESAGTWLPPEQRTPSGIAAALARTSDHGPGDQPASAGEQTQKVVRVARSAVAG